MIAVALRQGISQTYLEGHRILPLANFKEEEKEEVILHNLQRFFKSYKGRKANVYLAVPRDSALVKFITLPLAVEEDVRTTLGYEIDRHTPYSFDDVYYDFHILNRLPESNLLWLLLITVKRESVDYYRSLLEKLKIRPQGIEITTSARFNAFQRQLLPPEAPLDLSWIVKNNIIPQKYLSPVFKRFPSAAELFVEAPGHPDSEPAVQALVEYLSPKTYEVMLTGNGSLFYSQAFTAPEHEDEEPGFEDIYHNAVRSRVYLPASYGRDNDMRLQLAGKEIDPEFAERIPEHIRPFFRRAEQLPVNLNKKAAAIPAPDLPRLQVPVGLALKGIDDIPLDINVIPPETRPRRKKSKRKFILAASVVLFFAAIGAIIAKNAITMKTHLALLDEQLREYKVAVQEIENLESQAESIQRFSATIEDIHTNNVGSLPVLEELTELIPEDIWLYQFEYEADKKEVTLRGYAVSASKLIPLLEESRMFENVKFTSPITTDRRFKREKFTLQMNVTGAPLSP